MDQGFFGTKYFAISAAVAAAILVGAAVAYQVPGIGGTHFHGGCTIGALAGAPLDVAPETEVDDDGERRVVTYRLDAASFRAGAIDACSPFGEVLLDPSLSDEVLVRFVIEGAFAEAVESTRVEADLRDNAGALVVGAWVERVGETGTPFGGDGAGVRVEIRVPDLGPWSVALRSSAGDVHATDVMAGELDLESSFGNVVATGIDLAGDARVHTSSGNAILSLASVQAGRIDATSSFGDVDVELPERADVGYDVTGESSFGEVTIRIGGTERSTSDGDIAGDRETARSEGFDAKPTKVTVVGTTSSGDVRIVTSPTTAAR